MTCKAATSSSPLGGAAQVPHRPRDDLMTTASNFGGRRVMADTSVDRCCGQQGPPTTTTPQPTASPPLQAQPQLPFWWREQPPLEAAALAVPDAPGAGGGGSGSPCQHHDAAWMNGTRSVHDTCCRFTYMGEGQCWPHAYAAGRGGGASTLLPVLPGRITIVAASACVLAVATVRQHTPACNKSPGGPTTPQNTQHTQPRFVAAIAPLPHALVCQSHSSC